MNYWLIYVVTVSVVVTAAPKECPPSCVCLSDWIECSELSHINADMKTVEINNPKPLKLTSEIFLKHNMKNVQTLLIKNAVFEEIHEDAFAGLNLQHLMIHDSVVPDLPISLFSKLPYLKTVDFTNSTLKKFDIQSNSVEEIILRRCAISKLPENIFANCNMLSFLDLSNNLIEDFSGNFDLEIDTLILSNNKIRHFEVNKSLESLVTLDVSHNPIIDIKGGVDKIEKLNLHNCGLENIDFINEFSAVIFLNLSGNKIKNLDRKVFQNLKELEHIDLSHNELTSLSNTIFEDNSRLTKLVLNGNPMRTLPTLKSNSVFQISYLSCSDCKLKSLAENTFLHLQSLLVIDLSHNSLETVPDNLLHPISALVKIDLSNNHLKSIPEQFFRKNSQLMNVILSKNPIEIVKAELFVQNKVLRNLDISSCKIKNLWPSAAKPAIPSLHSLNAENNKIEVVTTDELNVTPKLQALLLAGNPMNCDSMFEDMRKWVKTNNVSTMRVMEEITSSTSYVADAEAHSFLSECESKITEEYSYEDDPEYDLDYGSKNLPSYLDANESVLDGGNEEYPEMINITSVFNKYPEKIVVGDDDKSEEKTEFLEDAKMVEAFEKIGARTKIRKEFFVYLLPTLVFMLTALIVLILSVSAILCVLQKRNSRRNIPQINILPWNAQKVKHNSGIVYQPLSEEKIAV